MALWTTWLLRRAQATKAFELALHMPRLRLAAGLVEGGAVVKTGVLVEALPSQFRWGNPCPSDHGENGRCLRYQRNGACVACVTTARARKRGKPVPSDLSADALIEAADNARGKPKAKRTDATKPLAAQATDVLCADPTCGKRLSRIALSEGSPWCSRTCAAANGEAVYTEQEKATLERHRDDEPTDADLAEAAA